MRRILLALAVSLFVWTPAYAGSYLIFEQGKTRTTQQWIGQQPQLNQMPAGAVAVPWVQSNGDANPFNYELQGSVAILSPPVMEPPVDPGPVPNPKLFKDSVFADLSIAPEAKVELIKYYPLVDQYYSQPILMWAAWGQIKAVYGGDGTNGKWLTPEVVQIVESYAVQASMPLTQPE